MQNLHFIAYCLISQTFFSGNGHTVRHGESHVRQGGPSPPDAIHNRPSRLRRHPGKSVLRHGALSHVPVHQPDRHQLRDRHVVSHAQASPRQNRRPPGLRQLHSRGLLPGASLPGQQVADSAVASAGPAEQRQLLDSVLEEAHGPLVQAPPQAHACRLARANAGVFHARSVYILDRQLPVRLEQSGVLSYPCPRLVHL